MYGDDHYQNNRGLAALVFFWGAICTLLTGCGFLSTTGQEPPDLAPQSAIFHGWDSYRFANNFIQVDVVPAVGGRVMQYNIRGKPFFWVSPNLAGKMPPESGVGPDGEWLNYGGAKLWPAPQGWDNDEQWPGPPDAVLDGRPYTAEVVNRTLRLTSEPDPQSGIQFVRTISLVENSSRVSFEVTMRNVDNKQRRWGIWEVVQLDAGLDDGTPNLKLKSYCPLNSRSHFYRGYNILFGANDNPAWQVDRQANMFTASYQYTVGKAVLDSPAGWIATVDGTCGKVFVQRFVYEQEKDYPDGASVEFWHNGRGSFLAWGKENVMEDDPKRNPCVAETELVSPFFRLKPASACTWSCEGRSADIGGDFPIVDCTSAGVVVKPLKVSEVDGKAHLTGWWGVFDQGKVQGTWIGPDGRPLAEFKLAEASPAGALILDHPVDCPVRAVSLLVELVGMHGKRIGELGRTFIARQNDHRTGNSMNTDIITN